MRAPVHKPVRWDSGQLQRQHNVRSAFYRTPAWRAVRSFVLRRDSHLCQLRLPGCQVRATIADHIVERRLGGSDGPENQRASCPACHNKRHPSKGGSTGGIGGSKV
jgi:5-methylcytosine-specific restriction protein A